MAGKIDKVSTQFWNNIVLEENKELIEEFLSQGQLSLETIKQYESSLKIFARWVHYNCRPKGEVKITDLTVRDARRYQDWLINQGLGNSAVKFKRSAVSSLCTHIEVYYADIYPNFRNIFTKGVKNVGNTKVKEKVPLNSREIAKLIEVLTERQEWQKLAYLMFTYSTGCRREESRQLKTEVVDYDFHVTRKGEVKNYYKTHNIRCKGKGREGKIRKFEFGEDAMRAIRKWVEYRKEQYPDDNCEYVFTTYSNKEGCRQVSPNTFNTWCDYFGEIIGKKVHPHLLRSSRATISVVEEGHDIKALQRLLGHNSSTTTEIYVVRDEDEGLDGLF